MARQFTKRASAKQASLDLTTVTTALYIRVSTVKQADEGYSLDAQRAKLDAYCLAQGWPIDEQHVYVDSGVSGKSTDRPAYQAMMAAIAAGDVRRIVAVKMDRFSRSVRDFLALLDYCDERKCGIVSISENLDTSTPVGRLMIVVIAAVAEMERDTIKERLMSGRTQKASEGGYAGGRVPYGYRYDGETWTVDENEADVVRRIFNEFTRVHHRATLTEIADGLNTDGVPTQRGARGRHGKGETPADERGGVWYPAGVRYLLDNGLYAGIRQWDGVESEDVTLPTIISKETYESAQARLKQLRRGRATA